MKKLVTLAMIMLLSLPLNASAEKVTFSTTDWPPYVFKSGEQLTGIYTEIIREICKRNGIEVDIHLVPWKRALKEVEEGSADAIFALKKNEEREKFLYFPSEPIAMETIAVLALKGSGIKIAKLDDLKGKDIGVVRAFSYTPEFDKYSGAKKIECDDDDQMLKILAAGRISLGVAADEGAVKYIAKKRGTEIETLYALSELPNFIGFSQKALGEKGKDLAEKFSKTLQELNKEGFIEKVKSKYF